MMKSCTRCGTTLSQVDEIHDCDGRFLRNAYENVAGVDRQVTVRDLIEETSFGAASILQWVSLQDDLKLVDNERIERVTVPVVVKKREDEAVSTMFLLTRVESLSLELGRKEVEIEILAERLSGITVPIAPVIRRLLHSSFRDIEFKYAGLTDDEKACGTEEELTKLLEWAKG